MKYSAILLAAVAAVEASPFPQAVTAAISPPAPAPSGCSPSYSGTFGIAVMNATASAAPQGVSTIADGQPQAGSSLQTAAPVSTIADGQPQAGSQTSVVPVTQISDGQIQATTRMTMAPINQIGDGQVQNQVPKPTATAVQTLSDGQPQNRPSASAVQTLSDGQPQNRPSASAVQTLSDGQPQARPSASAVQTIGDGQPQNRPTATAVNTIADGQPQAATATAVNTIADGQPQASGSAVNTLADGQPQASGTATTGSGSGSGTSYVACKVSDTLQITLAGGVLTDNQGRTGYIASNYQFQFDGPPQAGALYTAGFTVCNNGSLALGGSAIFYQCLSGDFYNLYDRSWAPQCSPINIQAVELVNC